MHFFIFIIPPPHPTSVDHMKIHLSPIYLIQKPTNGAPTLRHSTSQYLHPNKAKPSFTREPIYVCVLSTQNILYSFGNCIKYLLISSNPVVCFHCNQWNFLLGKVTHVSLSWGNLIFTTVYTKYPFSVQTSTIPDTVVLDIYVFTYFPYLYRFNISRQFIPIYDHPPNTILCFMDSSIYHQNPNQVIFLSFHSKLHLCYPSIHFTTYQYLIPYLIS